MEEQARGKHHRFQERDFKGVYIPKEIWLTPELLGLERFVFIHAETPSCDRLAVSGGRIHRAGQLISCPSLAMTALSEAGVVSQGWWKKAEAA
jgi:hypothetical protein